MRTSHSQISSDQFVSGRVQGIYAKEEEVSEAICLPLHGFYLVICAFQGASVDSVVVVCEDSSAVSPKGLSIRMPEASARAIQVRRWASAEGLSGRDQRSRRSSFMRLWLKWAIFLSSAEVRLSAYLSHWVGMSLDGEEATS